METLQDGTVLTMENKIINAINHIKFVSKKKPSINRILSNLRKSDEGTWEIKGLMTSPSDMVPKNLSEFTDGTYKVKETDFVEETQITSQIDDFTNSDTEKIIIPETQVTPRINKEAHTPIPGKAEIESLQDFQNTILSEMRNMRSFLETAEQSVIQIESTVIGSNKFQCNRQNQEPEFFVDLLRNRISALKKELRKML